MSLSRPLVALALVLGSLPLEAGRAFANLATAPQVVAVQPVARAIAPVSPALPSAVGGLASAITLPKAAALQPSLALQPAPALVPTARGLAAAEAARPKAKGPTADRLAAAAKEGGSGAAYDGSRTKLYSASPVALAAADPGIVAGAALPLAYAAHAYRRESRTLPAAPRLKLAEAAEGAMGWAAAVFLSFLAAGVIDGHALIEGLALGGVWAFGAAGMRQMVEHARGQVVGGWQASHDQKYRIGSDGRLKDVRGRKYGEDRWDRWAAGTTSPAQRLVLRLAAAATGLAFASAAGPLAAAAFGVSWTLATAAYDRFDARKDRRYEPTEEDKAFASRFRG